MRRGRGGNPFSLFAFQDIITSVSGIFIVIVLLLSLELIQRPAHSSPAASSPINELTEAIRKAEAELQQLKRTATANHDLAVDLAKHTPESLREKIVELKSLIERRESELR